MIGFGSLPRKEDARFIRGQGRFLDDVHLPGALHGAILRSPEPHAEIVSIDVSAALQHPKVHAVLTGADLGEMAWMPTMSADQQAVLATDCVRFQGQEVAFVIADDHYSARDALELIDVEYEPLPVVVDPRAALEPDAPHVRENGNRVFDWEAGDAAATAAAFARADVVIEQEMLFPRVHPAPLETCGAVADYDRVSGKLTVWCTTQAPHAHRTMYSLITGLPEHKIRVISPDVGGGFGNKVPIYPGYLCAVVAALNLGPAGQVGRGSVGEPDVDRVRARLRDDRADRGDSPRAGSWPSRWTWSPTTARSTPPPSRRRSRPGSSASSPAPTTSRPRIAASPARTRTRPRAGWRTRARSGSPRPST